MKQKSLFQYLLLEQFRLLLFMQIVFLSYAFVEQIIELVLEALRQIKNEVAA